MQENQLPGIFFFSFMCWAILSHTKTASADLPLMVGSGNVDPRPEKAVVQFRALNTIGAGMCRLPVQPRAYGLESGTPRPERFDAVIQLAYQHQIEPLLIFEYYTKWGLDIGSAADWRRIGRAFAERFAPNSDWLRSRGIHDWGVRYYSAINEPAMRNHNPEFLNPRKYANALAGLAQGVHEVDRDFLVSPGGWAEVPLRQERNPFPRALARLFNQCELHAICIHRYWDVDHVPMEGRYDWSLQQQFEDVKRKSQITADIAFYTDEFNFKLNKRVTEEDAARGFLTAFWDAQGVVGNKGQRVAEFALPWNIFHRSSHDKSYGLCTDLDPWTPTKRGQVLQLVCRLADGMEFVHCDPKGKGIFILEGNGKKLWVWQNRKAWTNRPGTTFSIVDLPNHAKQLEVYGWNGLRRTVEVTDPSKCLVQGLTQGETYMFLARNSR